MPSFHATALKAGFQIKDYVIDSVLGQGTFGITYKARDARTNRHVAMKEYFPREFSARGADGKVIPSGSAEDISTFAWGLEKFDEEARTLAKFDHPNIISVKRFIRFNGSAYLVMDYCDGEPLDAILHRESTLDEERIRSFLRHLLDGLERIHAIGVVHRDIKPGNIFIRGDGSPVLLDFGAARQELSFHSHSRSVTSMATDGYSPTEQYSTRSILLGPWSDIYAMAATLYRCVAGFKPQGAFDRQLHDELEPASSVAAGKYSAVFLKAIDHGLELKKENRPQNIIDWRDEFFGMQANWPPRTHEIPDPHPKKLIPPVVWWIFLVIILIYGAQRIHKSQRAKAELPEPETASTSVRSTERDHGTQKSAGGPRASVTSEPQDVAVLGGPREVVDMPFQGGRFSGAVIGDLPNGKGTYRRQNNVVDSGNFVNGHLSGHGTRRFPDESRHVGEFVADECFGSGVRFVPAHRSVDARPADFAAIWTDCANGKGSYSSVGGYNGRMTLRNGIWIAQPRDDSLSPAMTGTVNPDSHGGASSNTPSAPVSPALNSSKPGTVTPAPVPLPDVSSSKSDPVRGKTTVKGLKFSYGVYWGEIANGLPNGQGELQREGRIIDRGEFVEGKLEGQGSRSWTGRRENFDQVRYEGKFVASECNGQGSSFFCGRTRRERTGWMVLTVTVPRQMER